MKISKQLTLMLAVLMTAITFGSAQFVGPAPLVVPGDNYAFAYSTDGTIGGLTSFGLYFNETSTTTPGYEFKGSGGTKLVTVQSITKGNREPGDITFGNTGSLIVNPNRYAFRFSLTNSYGLFFNAAGFAYEFRTADASPVFSIGANSGDIAFDGTATIGSVPQDNALTEVLVKDATGLVHYRDAATLGGGGGLWTASGSNIYYTGGDVGIGTSNPTERLTLEAIDNANIAFSVRKGTKLVAYIGDGAGGGESGTIYLANNAGTTTTRFISNGGANYITAGNLGIGLTNPAARLQVHASPGQTALRLVADPNYLAISVGGTGIVSVDAPNIGGGRFIIQENGNVGIGTNNPTDKLTVKGKIKCSELNVVDLASIPDYVFKDDYDLMSLEEVSDFIDENGHLPNIPNEKEVRAEGVNIGELNMKLLEKIEELTLHMIEKDAQVNELNERHIAIQKQLSELKAGNH